MNFLSGIWHGYLRHLVDISIASFVIYHILKLVQGTRSAQVMRGILFLIAATLSARFLDLTLINWLMRGFWVAGAVALVIVFQPEIRNILAKLGSSSFSKIVSRSKEEFIDEMIRSLVGISQQGNGALLVLEQDTGLRNHIETGVRLNCEISRELIETIFTPPSPLHDGAVIISGDRVIAAGCILPLTHNPSMSKVIGTRHRAAVGLSENSDAVIIVVSEETGGFSVAGAGNLKQDVDIEELDKILREYYKKNVAAKVAKVSELK